MHSAPHWLTASIASHSQLQQMISPSDLLNVFTVMDVALWSRLAGLATCHLTLYSPLIYFISFLWLKQNDNENSLCVIMTDFQVGFLFILPSHLALEAAEPLAC